MSIILYNYQDLEKIAYSVYEIPKLKKYIEQFNNYILIDKLGNEYNQSNINSKLKEIKKGNVEFILFSNVKNEIGVNQDLFTQTSLPKKIIIQKSIKVILSRYLSAKKQKLYKVHTTCNNLLNKFNNLNPNNSIVDFENYFNNISKDNENFKNILAMIKQSNNKIENLRQKYNDNYITVNQIYNQTLSKFDENLLKFDFDLDCCEEKDLINKDINELIKIYEANSKEIKSKFNIIIDDQYLLFDLESKLNELLFFGEEINFYFNLSNIPNLFMQCKPKLDQEMTRRYYFKYIYNQIIDYFNVNFIPKEFELRKNFIKENCKLTPEQQMDQRSLEILGELLDIVGAEQFDDLLDKVKCKDSVNTNMDQNIKLSDILLNEIDNLQKHLDILMDDLYKKKKYCEDDKENSKLIINDLYKDEIKKNLVSLCVPEDKQSKILEIISDVNNYNNINANNQQISDNNILLFEKKENLNNSNNSLMASSFDENLSYYGMKESKMSGKDVNNLTLFSSLSKVYSKPLWFYNKIYNYLNLYNEKVKRSNHKLIKDPYSLNEYFVEVLNENINMRKKLGEICRKLKELKINEKYKNNINNQLLNY